MPLTTVVSRVGNKFAYLNIYNWDAMNDTILKGWYITLSNSDGMLTEVYAYGEIVFKMWNGQYKLHHLNLIKEVKAIFPEFNYTVIIYNR